MKEIQTLNLTTNNPGDTTAIKLVNDYARKTRRKPHDAARELIYLGYKYSTGEKSNGKAGIKSE